MSRSYTLNHITVFAFESSTEPQIILSTRSFSSILAWTPVARNDHQNRKLGTCVPTYFVCFTLIFECYNEVYKWIQRNWRSANEVREGQTRPAYLVTARHESTKCMIYTPHPPNSLMPNTMFSTLFSLVQPRLCKNNFFVLWRNFPHKKRPVPKIQYHHHDPHVWNVWMTCIDPIIHVRMTSSLISI